MCLGWKKFLRLLWDSSKGACIAPEDADLKRFKGLASPSPSPSPFGGLDLLMVAGELSQVGKGSEALRFSVAFGDA